MTADPSVWILWRKRQGDLDQMLSLVKALGWRHDMKKLSFRGPDVPVLAPHLLKNGDILGPPWPDVVISAEALPSMIALDLKRQSAGAIKAVCIGRPAGTPAAFDLVITTPQYRLPPAANIVEIAMPLSSFETPAEASIYDFDARRPLIAVLVGGSSFPDRLDVPAAKHLADDISLYAHKRGGTLAVVASPRTSMAVVQSLAAAIGPPHLVHPFSASKNLYRQVLAAADEIIVTSDSVSMVADAMTTRKPVSVYLLPQDLNLQWRLTEWLHRHAVAQPSPWLFPVTWLLDRGVMETTPDRRLLFRNLVGMNRLNWFGNEIAVPQAGDWERDLATAVESLRALVTQADYL